MPLPDVTNQRGELGFAGGSPRRSMESINLSLWLRSLLRGQPGDCRHVACFPTPSEDGSHVSMALVPACWVIISFWKGFL